MRLRYNLYKYNGFRKEFFRVEFRMKKEYVKGFERNVCKNFVN